MSQIPHKNATGLGIEWSERQVQVSELCPYERNPRTITKAAFGRLKDSLRQVGYHQRIIAQPDLSVIGGHQRIKALEELGIKTVTVLVPSRELSHEEFRRVLIQDNLPFGDFDFEILTEDFERDELVQFGMPETWLDEFGKDKNIGLTDPDGLPDLAVKAISQLGDVWKLGDHRVACGDSTSTKYVSAVLTGPPPRSHGH